MILETDRNDIEIKAGIDETGKVGEDVDPGDVLVYNSGENEWIKPDEDDGYEGTVGIALSEFPGETFKEGDVIAIRVIGAGIVVTSGPVSEGDWVATDTDGKVQGYSDLTSQDETKKIGKAKTPANAADEKIVVNLI